VSHAVTAPLAVVFAISGTVLTPDERAFLRDANPLGFILFARNCEDPNTIRALTADLRDALGREDAPILIDQEGGTVMRLRPPVWHEAPPAQAIGRLYLRDPDRACRAAHCLGALFGAELRDLGIDVNCAPVADLGFPETTAAIGTRAYSSNPDVVSTLCRQVAEGLMGEGCLPIIKHLPGHGRATVDSHRVLPRVSADLETLKTQDFTVFRALNDLPLGMSAHVVFEAIDPDHPATVSRLVIDQIIRGDIGFDGFLFSDDIAMSALSGTPGERARAVLSAGCDAVLHCTGKLPEMIEIATDAPVLSNAAETRWTRAVAARMTTVGGDAAGYAAELAELLRN
jgi:beta-N-acetylhexosaminidase